MITNKMSDIENFYENIITKFIEINVSTKHLKYLRELGYNVNMNDIVTIPIAVTPTAIGGIFTNTLLTLLVLPALYTLFKGKKAAEVEV